MLKRYTDVFVHIPQKPAFPVPNFEWTPDAPVVFHGKRNVDFGNLFVAQTPKVISMPAIGFQLIHLQHVRIHFPEEVAVFSRLLLVF